MTTIMEQNGSNIDKWAFTFLQCSVKDAWARGDQKLHVRVSPAHPSAQPLASAIKTAIVAAGNSATCGPAPRSNIERANQDLLDKLKK